jgi:acyl-CoA synthetase (AMP-forming)/AMP-acid ligase II/aryl carrier-like protein
MVEHRGLCNLAMAQARTLDIDADSRVLQCASFSFDACAFEIIMALCHGASLHLPKAEAVLAGSTLTQALAQQRITHATLTPAVLAALHEDATLSGVRTLVVAGDACTAELVRRWAPERLFVNAYGPTEATIWSTFQQCDAHISGAPPIGRPIANTRIYILDSRRRPVPIGVSGEIYIGGVGVARGYLNRPELTAERFVKDPFQAQKTDGPADPPSGDSLADRSVASCSVMQARMYRTGDVGRWRADGTIEYLGRNDGQVKIRGYRIELGEIETQLLKCEGIGEAVVLAGDGAPGEKRLVAYYTVKGEEPGIERLRGQLESKLPQYMVPAVYVQLESMPLTPNGKLDRRALPALAGEVYGQRGYEAPQGEVESTLAQLWQEVLQVERVGRHDNFFELGGHSLLAVTLIERMRQRGLAADVRSLFTAATLTEFARHLNDRDVLIAVPDNPLRDLHKKIDDVSSSDLIELTV